MYIQCFCLSILPFSLSHALWILCSPIPTFRAYRCVLDQRRTKLDAFFHNIFKSTSPPLACDFLMGVFVFQAANLLKRTEGLVTLVVSNPGKKPATPTATDDKSGLKASGPPTRPTTPVPGLSFLFLKSFCVGIFLKFWDSNLDGVFEVIFDLACEVMAL